MLDATPLDVGDPNGFHRRRRIDEFLLGEVERRHFSDPFSQLLEGDAVLGFLHEHFVQQGTEILGDWKTFLPEQVRIDAVVVVVGVLDRLPGTVTSNKGEEDHAE